MKVDSTNNIRIRIRVKIIIRDNTGNWKEEEPGLDENHYFVNHLFHAFKFSVWHLHGRFEKCPKNI